MIPKPLLEVVQVMLKIEQFAVDQNFERKIGLKPKDAFGAVLNPHIQQQIITAKYLMNFTRRAFSFKAKLSGS